MSIAVVENISISPAIAADLAGCFIDSPKAGSEHDTYCLEVSGWVLGRSRTVTAVEVLVENAVLQTVPARQSRPDIGRAFPDVPAADSCGFRTRVNLVGVPPGFEMTLKAVFDDGRGCTIGTIVGNRCRLGLQETTTVQPLLLTTFGRSGSTWVMRLLGQHSDIVAYRPFEFETRAGIYWTEVFRALSDPKSYQQPVVVTSMGKHWWLGPDDTDTRRRIPDPELVKHLGGANVTSLARLCHQQLDAFYHAVAAGAKYFAEKFLIPPFSRRLLLEWYPRGKEILLVRDPRDVFCSVESFNAKQGNVSFARGELPDDFEYMRMLIKRMGGLLRTPQQRMNAPHILRYEDIIREPVPTLETLLQYLEIDSSAEVIASILERASIETGAMRQHCTSGNPADSVGRWRKDLPTRVRDLFASEFGETMAQLGYD
jgi:hypothetical protein